MFIIYIIDTLATGKYICNLRTDTVTCFYIYMYLYKLFCSNSIQEISRYQAQTRGYVNPHPLKLENFPIRGWCVCCRGDPSSTPVCLPLVLLMSKSHIGCDMKNNISINICVLSCNVIFSLYLSLAKII